MKGLREGGRDRRTTTATHSVSELTQSREFSRPCQEVDSSSTLQFLQRGREDVCARVHACKLIRLDTFLFGICSLLRLNVWVRSTCGMEESAPLPSVSLQKPGRTPQNQHFQNQHFQCPAACTRESIYCNRRKYDSYARTHPKSNKPSHL